MLRYKLDDLGCYHFEWLVQSLLKATMGLLVESWGGSGDHGRDAFFDGPLRLEPHQQPSQGPFLFQAKFIEGANASGANSAKALKAAVAKEVTRIEERRRRGAWAPVKHYVLLTNAPMGANLRSTVRAQLQGALRGARVHPLAGSDLCDLLDAHPELRRAFPQLLSLRDLKALLTETVNRECLERSRRALDLAEPLVNVFVPTSPYEKAIETLIRYNFVVLEGPPEMGKSAIAWMIGLTQLAQGWEVISCDDPADIFGNFKGDRPQLFVSDDAFGRTEYDPSRGAKWERTLERVLNLVGAQHWLIWTTRKHILGRAVRVLDFQGKASQFPDPAAVLVDASKLSVREKALVLYRHARRLPSGSLSRQIVRTHASLVVHHDAFTPERIRYFAEERLPELAVESTSKKLSTDRLVREIREAIRNPTRRMRLAFQKLPAAHKWFLISMLEAGSWPTAADTAQHYERHCLPEDRLSFDQVTDEMSESFIRKVTWDEHRFSWVHPSYRDLVIEELSRDVTLRTQFLRTASIDGAKIAISDTGGAEGQRLFPLLLTESDWTLFSERCIALCHGEKPDATCELLKALAQAIPEAPESGVQERLRTLLQEACDTARRKWDESGDTFGPEELAAYASCSLMIDPIPPVPKLDKSWLVRTSPFDNDEIGLEMLEDWSKFVSAVHDTEPRFLKKVGFPEEYEDKLTTAVQHVQADLLETEVDDDELKERSDDCQTAANVITTLAPLIGERRDEWLDLGRRLAARATRLREKASEMEEDEPEYEADSAPQAFDIAALFADL